MSSQSSSNKKRKGSPVRSITPPPSKRRVQSITTQNAVSNFFKPPSEKTPDATTWSLVKSVLVARYRPLTDDGTTTDTQRRKVAAFDLDGTIIRSASGNKFSKDGQDWGWWNASVPGNLQALEQNGYQIIFFSNQGGLNLATSKLARDPKRVAEFKIKINALMNNFNFPITLYCATEKDEYRKPRTGMWRQMLRDFHLEGEEGVQLDLSFFIGDAAGRIHDEKGNVLDFASSDRDFAANIGIPFQTPEEYFLGQQAKIFKSRFDFTPYLTITEPRMSFKRLHDLEVVLFCGSPGAGKSTFFKTQLAPLGYKRINQDILKSRDKCLKVAREFLGNEQSVAIDNTNVTVETRALWVDLAKSFNVAIRCVLFAADPELCQHNEAVRAEHKAMNPEERDRLPKLAFTSFASRYQPPDLKEGFEDIFVVDFAFEGTEKQRALWAQYYI